MRQIISVSAFVWLAVVYGGYYAVHKPATAGDLAKIVAGIEQLQRPWNVSGVVEALVAIGIALWIVFVGTSTGVWILGRILGSTPLMSLERWTLGAPLGLGAISITVFSLGMAGVLYAWLLFAILLAATVISALQLRRAASPAITDKTIDPDVSTASIRSTEAEAEPSANSGWWIWILIVYVIVSLLISLLHALVPPTAWDSLVYHLTGPKLYIENHRVISGIDGAHFYFPPLMEMLFTATMLLGSDIAPALLHWTTMVITVGAVYCYSRSHWGDETALLAVAVLLSVPSLLILASQPYVEWALLLFTFLSFWSMEKWGDGRNGRWLLLSGVYAGLALGVKYTGIPFILGLGLSLLWHLYRHSPSQEGHSQEEGRFSWRGWGANLFLWGFSSAVVASPWYLKNLMFTGNPVYPFLFGGWNWDSWRAEWFFRAGSGLIQEPMRLLMLPWEMTVLGADGTLLYDATIGPVLLAVLPMALLIGIPKPLQKGALVALVGFLFWAYGVAQSALLLQTRLLFPAFPVLSLLVAHTVQNLSRWDSPALSLNRLVRAAILLVLILTLVSQAVGFLARSPLPFLVGVEGREAYLERTLGDYYSAIRDMNQIVSPDDRVLFLWEPRSYLCSFDSAQDRRPACQPDNLLFNWRYDLYRYGDIDAILESWRKTGFTHVLLHNSGLRYFSETVPGDVAPEHIESLRDMERRHLQALFGPGLGGSEAGEPVLKDGYTLYQILY